LLIEHIPHKRCGKYANEIWQQDNYVHIFEIKQEIEQIQTRQQAIQSTVWRYAKEVG
jgi:hypothetical protein